MKLKNLKASAENFAQTILKAKTIEPGAYCLSYFPNVNRFTFALKWA